MKKILLFVLISLLFTINSCKPTGKDLIKSGLAKFNLKDYRGAIIDYNKAIMINPKVSVDDLDGQSLLNLAKLSRSNKELDRIVESTNVRVVTE